MHLKLIKALAKKKIGMTREELIAATKLTNSGDLTIKLEELESCGFIRKYNSYGTKDLAFERVCLLHIEKIKQKLGISGVYTEINSWYCKRDDEAGIHVSQIDLLICSKAINRSPVQISEST